MTKESFSWQRNHAGIDAEAALDGLYVIRISLDAEQLDARRAVAACKSLAQVERAFRSMKTVDLNVRPVFHYSEPRVRAHVFLCSCKRSNAALAAIRQRWASTRRQGFGGSLCRAAHMRQPALDPATRHSAPSPRPAAPRCGTTAEMRSTLLTGVANG